MHDDPPTDAIEALRGALQLAGRIVSDERLEELVVPFLASRARVEACRRVAGPEQRPASADLELDLRP